MECESIFELAGIVNDNKVKWANAHIRGRAKTWLNSCGYELQLMNWTQFCQLLCERFPGPRADESMEQCQQLQQINSVDHYIDLFEDWMTLMKRDHNYLPESFFLLRFLSGLKESIKHGTKCHKPATLREAYWFARQQEKSYLSNKKKNTTTMTIRPVPNQAHNRPMAAKDNRVRNLTDKAQEKGKCWYCPENWTVGHRCNGVKNLVHAIELQGHSDEDQEQEQLNEPDQEQLMSISAHAVQGVSVNDTISLSVIIGGVQAIALVDSGSSNTFLDKQFVLRNNFPTNSTQARTVTVAGGGSLISDAIVPNCNYTIQRTQFTSDFKVLPLKGYDMVLGVNWLNLYNPTTFDWIARTLKITKAEKENIFTDHLLLQQSNIISAKQCSEILKKGTSGYLIQLFLIQPEAAETQQTQGQLPLAAQQLLENFSDLFATPSGLPPARSCDH